MIFIVISHVFLTWVSQHKGKVNETLSGTVLFTFAYQSLNLLSLFLKLKEPETNETWVENPLNTMSLPLWFLVQKHNGWQARRRLYGKLCISSPQTMYASSKILYLEVEDMSEKYNYAKYSYQCGFRIS